MIERIGGEKLTAIEVSKMQEIKDKWRDMSTSEKDEYKEEQMIWRARKEEVATSPRTGKAAQIDVTSTMNCMMKMVSLPYCRCRI